MKKILLLILCISAHASMQVSVSVIPQAFFVKKIAGDLVDVNIMVDKGKSPETYEPTIKQLKNLSNSKAYFRIGMPFEEAWLERFKATNPNMKIISPLPDEMPPHAIESTHNHKTHGDSTRATGGDSHENSHAHNHAHGDSNNSDSHAHGDSHIHLPHIWLSFILSKEHARQIALTLKELDSANAHIYQENLEAFLQEIDDTYAQAQELFKNNKKNFLVFHPAFGLVAHELGIEEFALEKDGKEPKISHTREILALIEKHHITTIFVQPQFSQKAAIAIAKQAGIAIDVIDPLEFEWLENLRNFLQKVAAQ